MACAAAPTQHHAQQAVMYHPDFMFRPSAYLFSKSISPFEYKNTIIIQ
jgi:hypothetical protein